MVFREGKGLVFVEYVLYVKFCFRFFGVIWFIFYYYFEKVVIVEFVVFCIRVRVFCGRVYLNVTK